MMMGVFCSGLTMLRLERFILGISYTFLVWFSFHPHAIMDIDKTVQSFFASDPASTPDALPKMLSQESTRYEIYNDTTDTTERVDGVMKTTKQDEMTTKKQVILNDIIVEESIQRDVPVGFGMTDEIILVRSFAYPSGTLETIEWYKNGKLDKDDRPAIVEYYKDGTIKIEEWYKDDQLHRDNAPAVVEYYKDKTIKLEQWYKNHKLHRVAGPAVVEYYENKTIKTEKWYEKDELHRIDSPAVTEYYQDKTIKSKKWYERGMLNRYFNEYALIEYYENGNVRLKEKYRNGQLSGTKAKVQYYPDQTVMLEESYRNGQLYGFELPAVVAYDENGKKKYVKCYRDDRLHNYPDQPAVIFYDAEKIFFSSRTNDPPKVKEQYFTDGVLMKEVWYKNDKISREGAAAKISYFVTGEIKSEEWYENGEYHRENNEPAKTEYFSPGKIKSQEWYKHGKRHRLRGPAKIVYDIYKTPVNTKFFFNGTEYRTRDAYERRLQLGIFKEPFLTEWFEAMTGGEEVGAFSETLNEGELEYLKKNGIDSKKLLKTWYTNLYYQNTLEVPKLSSGPLTNSQLKYLKENGIDYEEKIKNIYTKLLHDQYKNNEETKTFMKMQLEHAQKDFPDQRFVEFRVI